MRWLSWHSVLFRGAAHRVLLIADPFEIEAEMTAPASRNEDTDFAIFSGRVPVLSNNSKHLTKTTTLHQTQVPPPIARSRGILSLCSVVVL